MDFFTHLLVPLGIASIFKRNKEEKYSIAVGGISPDIDIAIAWIGFLFPQLYIISHRVITHTIIFSILFSSFCLYLATRTWTKNQIKKWLNIDIKAGFNLTTIVIAYFGALIHLFLDFITTHGPLVFYPFSERKFALELFYFADPLLFILGGIVFYIIVKRKVSAQKIKYVYLSFFAFIIILGGIRMDAKLDAINKIGSSQVYSTNSMFIWLFVKNSSELNKFYIIKFDSSSQEIVYSKQFDYFILSYDKSSKPAITIEDALVKSSLLPEVWTFKWNAYALSIKASYDKNNQGWVIEYQNPIRVAQMEGNPQFFSRIMPKSMFSIKVLVTSNKAEVIG